MYLCHNAKLYYWRYSCDTRTVGLRMQLGMQLGMHRHHDDSWPIKLHVTDTKSSWYCLTNATSQLMV